MKLIMWSVAEIRFSRMPCRSGVSRSHNYGWSIITPYFKTRTKRRNWTDAF